MSPQQRAFKKFADCIDSCTNDAHLFAALALIAIYRLRFPKSTTNATALDCMHQLKRIEVNYYKTFFTK